MEGVGEKWGELAIPCSFRKFLKLKKKLNYCDPLCFCLVVYNIAFGCLNSRVILKSLQCYFFPVYYCVCAPVSFLCFINYSFVKIKMQQQKRIM